MKSVGSVNLQVPASSSEKLVYVVEKS